MNRPAAPDLSICIPTYNRSRLLGESLALLTPQCSGRPVEICVSNNASTDATEALLESFPSVRWETRERNVGIDMNILAALGMAHGRYVLPIGDDELLAVRGVDSILAALGHKPDLLILNGWHRGRPHLPPALQGRCVTDLREAFSLLWDKMPLGGFVAPREYADPEYTHRYLGTHHAYSGAVWDYLLDQPRVRIDCMAHPVVEFLEVKKAWAAEADEILRDQIPRWFNLIPPYYADAVGPSLLKYRHTWGRTSGSSSRFVDLMRLARDFLRA